MLPYTAEALFALFDEYNRAIRPVPALALFFSAAALTLAVRARMDRSRIILAILAAGWLWTGAVYHLMFFTGLNFAAPVYGAVFILQGLLLIWTGIVRRRISIRFDRGIAASTGVGIAVISAAILPILDWQTGAGWTDARFALIAPGATAGFTIGLLMLSDDRTPVHLVAIPILWTFVSGLHAWLLDIPQDYLPIVIGIAAAFQALKSMRRRPT